MNLLSNLWSGIKSVGSSISSGLSSVGQYLGDQTAAAFNSLGGGPGAPGNQVGPNMSYAPPQPANPWEYAPQQNQSLMPNMSTPYGPGATNAQGQTVIYGQGGQMNPLASIMANSGSIASDGSYRPSTYTPPPAAKTNPTDEFGRTSNRDVGTPFINEQGKLIVPKTGFAGLTGFGGSGMSSTPMTVGASGENGGGSAFTGLLGSVGTAGATGSATLSDEEKRKQQARDTGTTNLSGITPPTQRALEGITAPYQSGQFNAPSVPDTIDAGYLSKVQESINKLATAGASLSANDRAQYISQIATNLVAAKQKLDQQVQIPEQPVVDTQEQLDFLNQSADPFGVKQAMDQFRSENTNLSELHATRVDLMKNIQALNDAYRPILKDIKDNPDLPKALARRRIEDLATTQKEAMQGFIDQLDIVKTQISDQNEAVNRAFNIVTFTSNQQNQAQDNIRQQLQLMLSSGAIAGFSELELKTFAQAANMPYAALQKAKEAAISPKVDIVTNEFADGTIRGIDKKTGKEVWRIAGAAKAGGETAPTQWQATNQAWSMVNSLLDPKVKSPSGAPFVDVNGFFTAQGFKDIATEAVADGINRQELIKQYADRFSTYGIDSGSYGLTAAEKKLLGFE